MRTNISQLGKANRKKRAHEKARESGTYSFRSGTGFIDKY